MNSGSGDGGFGGCGSLSDNGGGWQLGSVSIAAPSRLHFGLFSWGNPGRQFGGVGVMIEPPGLRLEVETLSAFGEPTADDVVEFGRGCPESPDVLTRIAEFRRRWAAYHVVPTGPPLRWRVLESPPRHAGLGSGTQWGLCVAAALDALSGRLAFERRAAQQARFADESAADRTGECWVREAAASVGRGLRSAVGAYGFALGGLIIEPGKLPGEELSPLERRFAVPDNWRFVLVCPQIAAETSTTGLHGAAERQAFARLPPVPQAVTERLRRIALESLAPAVERADCAAFSDAVFEYGIEAGNCFQAVQGGPFNGPILADLAHRMRLLGARGVGQSSWGPTLFAVMPTETEAVAFATAIAAVIAAESPVPADVRIAAPNNRGAVLRTRIRAETVSTECSINLESETSR
jgi:predicted sugar kinase